MLDVCFGDSECGTIKCALSKKNVTFSFRCLEIGKIAEKDFIDARKKWIDIYFPDGSKKERLKIINSEIDRFENIINAAKEDKELRIWIASSPCSKSGFYHLIYSLKDIACKIYVVELPDSAFEETLNRDHSWGELTPTQVKDFLKNQKELSLEERNIITEKWEKLAKENADLRLNINKELTSVDENYLDNEILACAPEGEYRLVAHIANVLVKCPHGINDIFIATRIEHLINTKKIIIIKKAKNHKKYYSDTILKKCV